MAVTLRHRPTSPTLRGRNVAWRHQGLYLQHILHSHIHLQVLLAVCLQPVVVEAIVVGGSKKVAGAG